jgi:hypothetical protein
LVKEPSPKKSDADNLYYPTMLSGYTKSISATCTELLLNKPAEASGPHLVPALCTIRWMELHILLAVLSTVLLIAKIPEAGSGASL